MGADGYGIWVSSIDDQVISSFSDLVGYPFGATIAAVMHIEIGIGVPAAIFRGYTYGDIDPLVLQPTGDCIPFRST